MYRHSLLKLYTLSRPYLYPLSLSCLIHTLSLLCPLHLLQPHATLVHGDLKAMNLFLAPQGEALAHQRHTTKLLPAVGLSCRPLLLPLNIHSGDGWVALSCCSSVSAAVRGRGREGEEGREGGREGGREVLADWFWRQGRGRGPRRADGACSSISRRLVSVMG